MSTTGEDRCGHRLPLPDGLRTMEGSDTEAVCTLERGHEGPHSGTYYADRCDWAIRWGGDGGSS